MTLFDTIKKYADKRGMSLQEVAEKAGLGKNSIYSWKTKEPSAGRLAKVADVLGIPVDSLVPTSSNPKPQRADLADDDVIFTFQGKPLSDEDKEIIKRLMNGK